MKDFTKKLKKGLDAVGILRDIAYRKSGHLSHPLIGRKVDGKPAFETCAANILIAPVTLKALYPALGNTSPIPPAPSGPTTSYGPSFAPEMRDIIGCDYTAGKPLQNKFEIMGG